MNPFLLGGLVGAGTGAAVTYAASDALRQAAILSIVGFILWKVARDG